MRLELVQFTQIINLFNFKKNPTQLYAIRVGLVYNKKSSNQKTKIMYNLILDD